MINYHIVWSNITPIIHLFLFFLSTDKEKIRIATLKLTFIFTLILMLLSGYKSNRGTLTNPIRSYSRIADPIKSTLCNAVYFFI